VSPIFKNLDKILNVYFDKQFISEYKKYFQKNRSIKSVPADEKIQEQLSKKINPATDFKSRIELLLTLAQKRLNTIKRIEFLLHIGEFTVSQGEFGTALKIYENVLEICSNTELESFSAYAYLATGDLYSRQANWDKAISFIHNAADLFKRQKDFKGIARCENLLGTIFGDKGDINQAQYHFEQSLTYLDPRKDSVMIGMLELNLGVLDVLQGQYDTALSYYQRALIKFEQVQDIRRIAEAKNDLGLLYTHKGEFDNALLEYDKSIAIALSINYLYALGVSYLSKAFIFAHTEDFILAEAFADKAMDIALRINDRLSEADIYKIKGIINSRQKKYQSAEDYFLTSLRINREIENILNEAEACYEYSLMLIEMGRITAARENLNIALGHFKKLNSTVLIEKVNHLLQSLIQ
jgi:tetratricopeptide (TPR) repeat protein